MKRASLPGADLEAEQGRELVVERSLEHEVVGAGAQLGTNSIQLFLLQPTVL